MEAGVDFNAEKTVGIALEVGEFGVSGWWKGVSVVAGKCPACGADVGFMGDCVWASGE
jgi:hypothetical protein